MSYWLEKLPMQGDYDVEVHDYIERLEYEIRHKDKESFDTTIELLIENYLYNQEYYEF